jgi:hypothetical protein
VNSRKGGVANRSGAGHGLARNKRPNGAFNLSQTLVVRMASTSLAPAPLQGTKKQTPGSHDQGWPPNQTRP